MPFFPFLRANAKFLLAGFLLAYLSSFGQTFFIAVFGGELRGEFGLSHGDWGAVYAVATSASAAVMLWAGVLTDRFRARVLGAFVMGGLALACLAMAANPVVWLLPVVIFALRFLGQGMMSHVSSVAMARWFVANRGRALAVAALGFSVGEATLPLLFVALKTVVHWRGLWVLAALMVAGAMPLLLVLLRAERTPQSMAQEAQATGLAGRHWTRGEVLRHPLFWLVLPSLLGPPAFNSAFFFHQVHLAEVRGWSHVGLVAMFPVYSVATVASMLASGWAVDRFGTAWLMALYQVPVAFFYLVMGGVETLAVVAPVMVLMGLSSGAQATVPTAFWAEFFGTRHIGAIKAMAGAVMVLGSALGPLAVGLGIDAGFDMPSQMALIAAWFALSCILVAVGVRMAQRRTG